MKSRESFEAALCLCVSGDEQEDIEQNGLSPNIAFGWTVIIFHMQEIWGSSIGQEAGNPVRSFRGFPYASSQIPGRHLKLCNDWLHLHSSQFIIR
jgi:hypothetical protein